MKSLGIRITSLDKDGIEGASSQEPFKSIPLHPSEIKLIKKIRDIGFGEIEGLIVENGFPVSYKTARKARKLA